MDIVNHKECCDGDLKCSKCGRKCCDGCLLANHHCVICDGMWKENEIILFEKPYYQNKIKCFGIVKFLNGLNKRVK